MYSDNEVFNDECLINQSKQVGSIMGLVLYGRGMAGN